MSKNNLPFFGGCQRLVLFVFDLPVDDVLAAYAEAVVLDAVDFLDRVACVVQIILKNGRVLMLLRLSLDRIASLTRHDSIVIVKSKVK